MADEIRVDYARLQQVAAQFSRQATAINQMQQQVKRRVGQLQSAWVGKGSDAFFAEMNDKVLPATDRLQRALRDASKTTQQIAQLMAQAEEDAAAPFRGQASFALQGGGGGATSASGDGTVQGLASRWAELSDSERRRVIEGLANDIGSQYGLRSIPVWVVPIPDGKGLDARGAWNPLLKVLILDNDDLSQPQVIDDVAHEVRHAVQQSLGDKAAPGLWDSMLRRLGLQDEPQWPQYGISEETARSWDANNDNYHRPPASYDPKNPDSVRQFNEYLNQTIEVDARDYAKKYYDGMNGADLDKYLTKTNATPVPGPTPAPTPVQRPSQD